MEFLENLPAGCPPADAEEVASETVVFRIVGNRPPVVDDFYSQRRERPHARFTLPECLACGASVFANADTPTKNLKLPKFRGKRVAKVKLISGSGYVKKTLSAYHYTFWPFRTFDPIEVVEEEAP
jgi:hypothetical protein